jgi:hypothetical protein
MSNADFSGRLQDLLRSVGPIQLSVSVEATGQPHQAVLACHRATLLAETLIGLNRLEPESK